MAHHEDLHLDRLQPLLRTRRFGRSLEIRDITDSTNDDARAAANAGAPDGHVVLADAQRRGRGAHGRTWISPAGTDLYLSIVARLAVPLSELAVLTLAVGLGVADAVDSFVKGGRAGVKWPNDVWLDRSKVAGVLVESASLGQSALPVVIGIGLNVNRDTFPPDLDNAATSLSLASGQPQLRAQVFTALLAHVEHWVDIFASGDVAQVVSGVNERLCLRGQQACCGELQGEVVGVAASGALQLRVNHQVRELFAGTLRPA